MCGIVGYIGYQNAGNVLLDGLEKLEYRGYDSAGIAIFKNNEINIIKTKGRLVDLQKKVKEIDLNTNIGIGHTRWATHGEPNDVNSHPHLSHNKKIAVVHNGIIENYLTIKEFLIDKGVKFLSDTDTEVISHLIEYYYEGDIKSAVLKTLNDIEGSYALGVLCLDFPDKFIAARKDSPLIVGIGKGENFIASDIPAILKYTRDIYILEDKEIVELDKDSVNIYNMFEEKIQKEIFKVTWDVESAQKSGYEHFMMKEMYDEPKALRDTINPRVKDQFIQFEGFNINEEYLEGINKIFIVACGTAYHSGVVGKYVIEKFSNIPVEVDVASEFRYRDPIIDQRTLVIIISQSGETLDTLFALRESRSRGAKTISIVNVVGSTISRESDHVIYTMAGPEISVASTKAYNTQLAVLYLLALKISKVRGVINEEFYNNTLNSLSKVSENIEKVLLDKELIQKFAAKHYNASSIFFIGRGLDYALSMEGSLKLKEISYIHSEAYAGGELKHGTIALIEKGTLVVCPMTQENLMEKMLSNIKEVKARGAIVMAITYERLVEKVRKTADVVITIPDMDCITAPIVAVTPLQLFAYYMAVEKGCDVDKPRNLAKSVTVE